MTTMIIFGIIYFFIIISRFVYVSILRIILLFIAIIIYNRCSDGIFLLYTQGYARLRTLSRSHVKNNSNTQPDDNDVKKNATKNSNF